MLDRLRGRQVVLPGSAETPAGEPRKDGGPADLENRLTDEQFAKRRPFSADGRCWASWQADVRGNQGARCLIVGKKEDDVGTLGVELGKDEEEGEDEESMFHLW